MTKPKVKIFADGGDGVGLGHLSRSISLFKALKSSTDVRLFHPPSDVVRNHLDQYKGNWNDIRFTKDSILEAITGNETVVIDSYQFNFDELEAIRERADYLVCFDDIADRKYGADMIVNGNPGADRLNYQATESIRLLLGANYQILRPEFQNDFQRNYEDDPDRILILSGGSPEPKTLRRLYNYFETFLSNRMTLSATFVIGPFADDRTLKETDSLTLRYDPDNLMALMETSDIAVSAGGQTLYELSRCGLPTVAYCLGEDQLMNLKALDERGAISYIGWLGTENWTQKLDKALRNLLSSSERRSTLGEKASRLIDGKGARRVADEIIKESDLE
jgi:spore coat polysaccharide biosynthesis predicted glycosyltransferase SpsG